MTASGQDWPVLYSRPAEKDIAKLDPQVRKRILAAIAKLAQNPHSASNVRALSGRPESRLRVSSWRIIFEVSAARREIYILRVLPRRRAYDR